MLSNSARELAELLGIAIGASFACAAASQLGADFVRVIRDQWRARDSDGDQKPGLGSSVNRPKKRPGRPPTPIIVVTTPAVKAQPVGDESVIEEKPAGPSMDERERWIRDAVAALGYPVARAAYAAREARTRLGHLGEALADETWTREALRILAPRASAQP